MKTRIDQCLERLRGQGRKGFVAYITAGDPSLKETVEVVLQLEKAGADIVELGVPFSDPLADGRVNQDAATRALAAGATWGGLLDCVKRIRSRSQIPLILYSYLNPLIAGGFERTVRQAAAAGVDGFLVVDLPAEEMAPYARTLRRQGLNNICLITPTSPPARIRKIVGHTSGFAYCVSREGVTGMQKQLAPSALTLIRRTRRCTKLPIALGFGISTPAQARAAAAEADAVVVGSAIVNRFANAPRTAAGRTSAGKWTRRLVRAVKEL
ncbi:MAG: tryptophan synthase subunit alpha [Verrucomicrobia bacterium]|nr:tryptophan synthase subunit alpha [Verrucomicrobiota bacterium]MBU1908656.1 tryptophan synthase subunit alpha [Verrucomicrobiota bacterium]